MNPSQIIGFVNSSLVQEEVFELDSVVTLKLLQLLRGIAFALEDEEDISQKIWVVLNKTATSDYLPESGLLKSLGLEDIDRVRKVWGEDVASMCIEVNMIINKLSELSVNIQSIFLEVVRISIAKYGLEEVKIYCHSSEVIGCQESFNKIGIYLGLSNFITSKTSYLHSNSFSVLVVLGVFKSFGWAKKPKIIVSCPKYRELKRIKMSFAADEDSFGRDPLVDGKDYFHDIFQQQVHSFNDESLELLVECDAEINSDLEIFDWKREVSTTNEATSVSLHFKNGYAVLLPLGSHVLLLEKQNNNWEVSEKKSVEATVNGFYIYLNFDVENAQTKAEKTELTLAWKIALNVMVKSHYQLLISKCRMAGIQLKSLDNSLNNWCKPISEGLHAPQSPQHFKALIEEVLPSNVLGEYTWVQAWQEVKGYRAKAIIQGKDEHELLRRELIDALMDDIERIGSIANGADEFEVNLDESWGGGSLLFNKISDISYGWVVPREKAGLVLPLEEIDLYRRK